jgi:hypothetical protein
MRHHLFLKAVPVPWSSKPDSSMSRESNTSDVIDADEWDMCDVPVSPIKSAANAPGIVFAFERVLRLDPWPLAKKIEFAKSFFQLHLMIRWHAELTPLGSVSDERRVSMIRKCDLNRARGCSHSPTVSRLSSERGPRPAHAAAVVQGISYADRLRANKASAAGDAKSTSPPAVINTTSSAAEARYSR